MEYKRKEKNAFILHFLLQPTVYAGVLPVYNVLRLNQSRIKTASAVAFVIFNLGYNLFALSFKVRLRAVYPILGFNPAKPFCHFDGATKCTTNPYARNAPTQNPKL